MRKGMVVLALAALALANASCVTVLKVRTPPHKGRCCQHVMEIDGEMYNVDFDAGTMERVDPDAHVGEKTIIRTEVED